MLSTQQHQQWDELFQWLENSEEVNKEWKREKAIREEKKKLLIEGLENKELKKVYDDIIALGNLMKETIDGIDDDWTFQNEFSIHWSNHMIHTLLLK